MGNTPDAKLLIGKLLRFFRSSRIWKVGGVLVLIVLAFLFFNRGAETRVRGTTFTVKRGPLKIVVTEGGTSEALESQDIKSEVRGQTKILSIVEEGYLVTEEDVKNGKVLVELDSAELVTDLTQQEIQYQSSLAAFTEANSQYEIQVKQNESDITAAELGVKFKRLDLEKYVGSEIARDILKTRGIPYVKLADADLPVEVVDAKRQEIDYNKFANDARLGGEAQQKRRTLQTDILMSSEDLNTASTQFMWTEKLHQEDFVTTVELDKDRIAKQRSEIKKESSETAEDLFFRYEFPKETEKLVSDYEEALRMLDRTEQQAFSKLAQADARLKSAEVQHKLQTERRDKLQQQINKCVIKAERPGLVVYGGSERYYSGEERIREGATVRERQQIITIPDMTQMCVKVRVHESSVKRVAKGQKVKIRLESEQDTELTGEVIRVAVLPDSERRWMNPDLKVYTTTISIDGVRDWLKPGMTAKAEILIKELPDVLYVPINAVSNSNGDRVCYAASVFGEPERRIVETGEFNDEFIEIRSGLNESQEVYLRSPVTTTEITPAEKEKASSPEQAAEPKKSDDTPAPQAAPAPGNSVPTVQSGPVTVETPRAPRERRSPEGGPRGPRERRTPSADAPA